MVAQLKFTSDMEKNTAVSIALVNSAVFEINFFHSIAILKQSIIFGDIAVEVYSNYSVVSRFYRRNSICLPFVFTLAANYRAKTLREIGKDTTYLPSASLSLRVLSIFHERW